MKNEIIFASGNKGKIKEVQEILNEYKIISMNELKIKLEVEEDGKTFEENAVKKAKTLAKMLEGKMCLAAQLEKQVLRTAGLQELKA